MPSIESFNSDRSSGELSRRDSRRLGGTALNATKKFSEMTKEERNAFFDSIARGSNETTPHGPRTSENSRNSERIRNTKEKAKRNSSLKEFIARATVGAVAVGMLAGAWVYAKNNEKNANSSAPTPKPELGDFFQAPETPNEYEAYNLGIYDGYNEPGMFTSENKTSSVAFADAGEVAEICNNDECEMIECEMIKYTAHNQVESFADYMANLPEQLQPEGFKGLSLKETEAKLESLSDEEFTLVENQFRNIIDSAFTRRVIKNGTFHNAFMRHKGGDFIHENMELVHCTTNESNLEVTEFYWVDQNGNEIGTMDVKIIPVRDKDGNIISFKGCEQVINPYGEIYVMLPDIPPEPENPTPAPGDPDPTKIPVDPTKNPDPTKIPVNPTENPTPLATKNPEEEKRHAGDRVDTRELNEEITPATDIKQDQENFKAIEQQKQEDASRKAEADRVASDQAEKEKKAAAEAEAKRQAEKKANERKAAEEKAAEAERQRKADEAAKKAQSEAEAAQRAAAEAERKAAAEREARERAQAEANARAEAARKEAESNANATAQERADMFGNGDF